MLKKDESMEEEMETMELETETDSVGPRTVKLLESKPKERPKPAAKPRPTSLWVPPNCPGCSKPLTPFTTDAQGWTCSECNRELDRGVKLNNMLAKPWKSTQHHDKNKAHPGCLEKRRPLL